MPTPVLPRGPASLAPNRNPAAASPAVRALILRRAVLTASQLGECAGSETSPARACQGTRLARAAGIGGRSFRRVAAGQRRSVRTVQRWLPLKLHGIREARLCSGIGGVQAERGSGWLKGTSVARTLGYQLDTESRAENVTLLRDRDERFVRRCDPAHLHLQRNLVAGRGAARNLHVDLVKSHEIRVQTGKRHIGRRNRDAA